MTTLVYRMNPETAKELRIIEAEAVALAVALGTLAPGDFERVKYVFDRFFSVLECVNANLILVDVEEEQQVQ